MGVDAPGSHVGGANRHSENAVVAPARLVFCYRNGEFIASGEPGVVRIGGVVLRVDDEAGFGHAQIDIEPDAVRRVHIPRVRDVRQRNRHRSAVKLPMETHLKSWNSSEGMEIL